MQVYEQALVELAESDPRIVVMTAENRAALRSLGDRIGKRFLDVGIAEQTLLAMAAGLARAGRRPVVHALAAFLTMRAFEFIRTDIGIPGLPVILTGYVPGLLSEANGPTHQAIEDIGLMRLIPGMGVYSPATVDEIAESLPMLIRSGRPWYIRYTSAQRDDAMSLPKTKFPDPQILREGEDCCFCTHGIVTPSVLQAAELLEQKGISARVVYLPVLSPVPEDVIDSQFRKFPLIVAVEDHFRTGGLSSILAERLASTAHILMARGLGIPRIVPHTLGDRWFTPCLMPRLLKEEGFNPEHLADQIHMILTEEKTYAE